MVAVLTVFACHLWHWPRGGFVGVDVFFVISGFLITGNLLRTAEREESRSAGTFFWGFYWRRIRRIVPAATVVLIAICVAATLMFQAFRSHEVSVDAFWAFVFLSNWWFAIKGTDYFRATDAASPVQHYWSLSIEEQFYFVWPAIIFVIGLMVLRKAWTHEHRMRTAAMAMTGVVVLSFGWALYETASSPTWAYFNTFARVWELGVGALLACTAGAMARIPDQVRPVVSWTGIALIAVSVALISDQDGGFPAPWAVVPVAGSALVIAAGVGQEPKYQAFLRNPVSEYIGNISYSLYLVHWPVIIFTGYLMTSGASLSIVVIALAFGLAVLSYHCVETPLRHFEWAKFRSTLHEIRKRRYRPQRSSTAAVTGAFVMITLALVAFSAHPYAHRPPTLPPVITAADSNPGESDKGDDLPPPPVGPRGAVLQQEISDALKATAWPQFQPPMEQVLEGGSEDPAIAPCTTKDAEVDIETCSYGSPTAPVKVAIVGDSEGNSFAGALRHIALDSGGAIQVIDMALQACPFTADLIDRAALTPPTCDARKRNVVDTINKMKPTVVIVANLYLLGRVVGGNRDMSPGEWSDSQRRIIGEIRPSIGKVVFLSGPPGRVDIKDCFGQRSNIPADCIGKVSRDWNDMASAERQLASSMAGVWIDSRPWFCDAGLCPSFAGVTATKSDKWHMSPAYGEKIYPVMDETFRAAGVY